MLECLGSSLPRSKYILDPSVKSSSAFGQSYVPPPQPQTFGAQPQAFGGQPQVYGGQPQAFGGQPNTYGSALPPTGNHPQSFNQFNTQPFNPAAIPVAAPSGPPSVLNPTPVGAFVPTGLPPIELAQPAISQQPMQRNPTPPPGWNDPPALKSRVVCLTFLHPHVHHICMIRWSELAANTLWRYTQLTNSHSQPLMWFPSVLILFQNVLDCPNAMRRPITRPTPPTNRCSNHHSVLHTHRLNTKICPPLMPALRNGIK